MIYTAEEVFAKMPGGIHLYHAFEAAVLSAFEDVRIKVSKTQISFSNRYGFAYASPPHRKHKDLPENFIFITFGLPDKIEHPRIYVATEPYPRRWTHHIAVSSPEEIDDELMGWIEESYWFSMNK